ncbi:putative HD-GYP domain protein [uncultured Desulfobacterium sp.]|uniref:Putative HD-GYP domain protein n=1 Tax=uncultured Desulfobacterium sp. TaxID=201089 RepID=A0A445N2J1_9BACT|nr:putative HD-GYP domain protein [uncultured Desulfobacterium sp.]
MAIQQIIVVNGPEAGRGFVINQGLSIGRGVENDLSLADHSVSRRHAVIRSEHGMAVIYDMGAANGVIVNGRRVDKQALKPGDEIGLGKTLLRFEESATRLETEATSTGIIVEPDLTQTVISASSVHDISASFLSAPETARGQDLAKARERLAAVYRANQVISRERNLNKLLEQIVEQVFSLVTVHNCAILLRDEKTGAISISYARSSSKKDDIVISSTIVERAVENSEAIITSNALDDTRFDGAKSIILHNISSAMCAPLMYLNEVLGAIYVDVRGLINVFKNEDLELLVALAGPAAIAIKNVSYVNQLDRFYRDTLVVLANAIELRDHYTAGHIWRVTNFAIEMARELGWDEERVKMVEMGGVLHDIGKISVDNAILSKSGMLTSEEYEKIKLHPERGAWLMRDSFMLKPLIPYCLYHHERYDGTGYPFGLDGAAIPAEGRLIAVADAFDALTSNRPYHDALPIEEAVKRIVASRGKHFDPKCVDALVRCYHDRRLDHIFQEYMKNQKSIICPFCSTFIRIPEKDDQTFQCPVCRRKIKLHRDSKGYSGELAV